MFVCQPGAGSLLQLFERLGIDEEEEEALVKKHPQLRTTPVEFVRQRMASLRSVCVTDDIQLHRTILKTPRLLTVEEFGPFLEYVHDELPELLQPTKLQHFLAVTNTKTLPSFPQRVRLLLSHGVPVESLGRFLNNLNLKKVFSDNTVEEIEATIIYLKNLDGFSWLLRRPQLLNLNLQKQLVPRIDFLTELNGGDKKSTAALLSKLPYILAYTVEHYKRHLELWHKVGLKDEDFFKVALVYPNIFSISRDRKLVPRMEFLQQCGLDSSEIVRFLTKSPLFLSLSWEANLSKKLVFLVKIGYRHRTKQLAAAMGWSTRTSCENMQMVIGVLLEWGFSCEDVMEMGKKQPQILQYNHKLLEKKMKYLVEDMDRDIGELLAFPAFLGYKLNDRIKMRYEAKKDIRGKHLSINKLLSVSAERFFWNDVPPSDEGYDNRRMEELNLIT